MAPCHLFGLQISRSSLVNTLLIPIHATTTSDSLPKTARPFAPRTRHDAEDWGAKIRFASLGSCGAMAKEPWIRGAFHEMLHPIQWAVLTGPFSSSWTRPFPSVGVSVQLWKVQLIEKGCRFLHQAARMPKKASPCSGSARDLAVCVWITDIRPRASNGLVKFMAYSCVCRPGARGVDDVPAGQGTCSHRQSTWIGGFTSFGSTLLCRIGTGQEWHRLGHLRLGVERISGWVRVGVSTKGSGATERLKSTAWGRRP